MYGCFGMYRSPVEKSPVLIGSPKPYARGWSCATCEVYGFDLSPKCWNCGSTDIKIGAGGPGGGFRGETMEELLGAT